jgi:hypothetical protein
VSRIVTRGLGPRQQLVTRGFGAAIARAWREILRRCSPIPGPLARRSHVGVTLARTSSVVRTLALASPCGTVEQD